MSMVRPDPEAEPHLEENRLEVHVLPPRLQLDKDLLAFVQVVGAAVQVVGVVGATGSAWEVAY